MKGGKEGGRKGGREGGREGGRDSGNYVSSSLMYSSMNSWGNLGSLRTCRRFFTASKPLGVMNELISGTVMT